MANKPTRSELLNAQCQNCLKQVDNSKVCSGCLRAQYCDRACQKAHWKLHKPLCEMSKKASGPIDETTKLGQQALQEFTDVHRAAIVRASAHALGLYLKPPAYHEEDYCVIVELEPVPGLEHVDGKRFRLKQGRVVSYDLLASTQPSFKDLRKNRALFAGHSEGKNNLGEPDNKFHSAFVLLQCHLPSMDLANIVPFQVNDGILQKFSMDRTPTHDNWVDWLRAKFYRGTSI